MKKSAKEPSKKSDKREIRVEPHFESGEEAISQALDILASLMWNYMERKAKNEKDNG